MRCLPFLLLVACTSTAAPQVDVRISDTLPEARLEQVFKAIDAWNDALGYEALVPYTASVPTTQTMSCPERGFVVRGVPEVDDAYMVVTSCGVVTMPDS